MWKKSRIYVEKCGKQLLPISRLKHKTWFFKRGKQKKYFFSKNIQEEP
jgi:hypothetical protein